MRVLFVEHKTVWGGAQVALVNLLREWERTKAPMATTIVCPPDAALVPRVRALGMACIPLDLGAIEKRRGIAWNLAQRLAPTTKLLRILRRTGAQGIIANGAFSFLASVLAAKYAHVPIVWIEHNTTLPNDYLVRRMLHWANQIVVVSEAIREQFVNLAPEAQGNIITIHNGVDTEEFRVNPEARCRVRRELGWDENLCVVGTVGRLSPEKGIEYFVDAAAEIAAIMPETRFLVAGDGPQRAELETRAAGRVRFLGWREDMPDIFNALDVFALPSLAEAFGLAAVQAMATQVPVVASHVGGLREIIRAETGLLVPPREAHALAQGILTLLRNQEMRRAFGARGRDRVLQQFTLAQQAEQMQTILEQLEKG